MPTWPAGSGLEVVMAGVALVAMVSVPLVAVEYDNVNVAVAAETTDPVIAPVEVLSDAQVGRLPDATAQLDEAQPLSLAVCEYD